MSFSCILNTTGWLVSCDDQTHRVLCDDISRCLLNNWLLNNCGCFPRSPLIKCCVSSLLDKCQHGQDCFRPTQHVRCYCFKRSCIIEADFHSVWAALLRVDKNYRWTIKTTAQLTIHRQSLWMQNKAGFVFLTSLHPFRLPQEPQANLWPEPEAPESHCLPMK